MMVIRLVVDFRDGSPHRDEYDRRMQEFGAAVS